MANVKITALTNLAASDVADEDVFVIDDVSVPESKKVTVANLKVAIDTIATSNINTVSSNVDTLETSVNTILANVNSVSDNVALVGANTVGLASNAHSITATSNILPGTNNTFTLGAPDAVFSEVFIGPNSLKLGSLTLSDTGSETLTITGASGSKGNISTAAVSGVANLTSNVVTLESDVNSLQSNTVDLAAGIASISVDDAAGTEARLNANLDITNDNVSANFTQLDSNISVVQDNVAAVQSRLTTNVTAFTNEDTALQSRLTTNVTTFTNEDTALQSRLATNVTAFTNEDTALQARITANTGVAASNDFVTFTRLNSNISVVQDNVANITDGTTPFSAPVTFTDNVTVSGSLIVTGAQVDLGVQTATVDNNFIELSAELGPGDTPATDSGLLINRGNKGNVFIGDHLGEDGVIFVRTQSPDTNTTIAIESFMDLHANMFHAAGPVDLGRVHFGLRAAEDTGIVIDESGANINFVIDGSALANVHYDGTLNSQNAIIAPAVFSDGVELQANDSATLFSAYSNDFITYTQLNANLDVVQDNVDSLTTTVDNFGSSSNSNAAALAAGIATLSSVDTATGTENRLNANLDITNDNVTSLTTTVDNFGTYANTNLDTKSNVSATFIQLNANISVVQDNVDTLTTTVDNFGTYANTNFSTTSNAAELAAGIVGAAAPGFPTGDYGILDAANSATDAFGETTADLDTFDMKTAPVGELATEDLGALT